MNEQNDELQLEKQKVIDLRQLKQLWAYQILKSELEQLKNNIEEDLFEVKDNTLVYTGQDLNREIRKIIKMFIELPDDIIEQITWVIEIEPE